MSTRGRADRVYLFLVAPTSKGLPGQRLDVALHKIHPYIPVNAVTVRVFRSCIVSLFPA
jgi:hypothetical protein